MRVLHAANFSWLTAAGKRGDDLARYYSTDRKISAGFARNGACVWDFSFRHAARYLSPVARSGRLGAGRMNAALLAAARAFAPDLLLLGQAESVAPQTLAAIREALPQCKIALWRVDSFSPRAVAALREKIPHLDAFFATTSPRAYIPLLENNGGNGDGNDNGNGNAHRPRFYYMPNIADASVETGRAFASGDFRFDVFFAGAEDAERAPTLEVLRRAANGGDNGNDNDNGFRLGLFGAGENNTLGGAELPAAIAASKIGLNLSRFSGAHWAFAETVGRLGAEWYSSDRIVQIAGNGALLLTPRTPGMTALFSEDEAAYFDGAEEMLAQICRFLADDRARRAKSIAGWRRAHLSYNERRVTRFLREAVFGEDFGERYEWL